ncbi:hypothetical protein EVAR_81272_1 [Eumeta japonica]|uniref:Uncharacterized protein n=1 Tax=Eumeta variegata TaxID=151549 RepID=A0A4C1WVL4_EUMVA|nr:hypothetical protein EVAR_81272_1 [Eumeta japonica]
MVSSVSSAHIGLTDVYAGTQLVASGKILSPLNCIQDKQSLHPLICIVALEFDELRRSAVIFDAADTNEAIVTDYNACRCRKTTTCKCNKL